MRSLSRDFVSKTSSNSATNQNTSQATVVKPSIRENSSSGRRDNSAYSTARAPSKTMTTIESSNVEQPNIVTQIIAAKRNLAEKTMTIKEEASMAPPRESRSRLNQHVSSSVRSVSTASIIEKPKASLLIAPLASNNNNNDVRSRSIARLMQDKNEEVKQQQRESRSRSNQPANASTTSMRSLSTASITERKTTNAKEELTANTSALKLTQPSSSQASQLTTVRSSSISGRKNEVNVTKPISSSLATVPSDLTTTTTTTTTTSSSNSQYSMVFKKVNSKPAPAPNLLLLVPSPSMSHVASNKATQQQISQQQPLAENTETTKVRVISKDTMPPKPSISRSNSSNSMPITQQTLRTTESTLHQLEALQEAFNEKNLLSENNNVTPTPPPPPPPQQCTGGNTTIKESSNNNTNSNNTQKILSDSAHLKKLIKNYLKAELKNSPYLNNLNPNQSSEYTSSIANPESSKQSLLPPSSQKVKSNSSSSSSQAALAVSLETLMPATKNLKITNPNESSKNINEFVGPFYDKSTNKIFFKDKLNNIVNNNLSVTIPNIGNNVNRIFAPTLSTENSDSPTPLITPGPVMLTKANINSNNNSGEKVSYFKTESVGGSKRFNLEDYLYKPTQPLEKEQPIKKESTAHQTNISNIKTIKLNSNSSNNVTAKSTKQALNSKVDTQINSKSGEDYLKSLSKTNLTSSPPLDKNTTTSFIPIRANDLSLKLYMTKPLLQNDTSEDILNEKAQSNESSPSSFLSEQSYIASNVQSSYNVNLKKQPTDTYLETIASVAMGSSPILLSLSSSKTNLSSKKNYQISKTLSPSPAIASPSFLSPDSELKTRSSPFSPKNISAISPTNKPPLTPSNKPNEMSSAFEQASFDDSFNMQEVPESLILSPTNQLLNEENLSPTPFANKKSESNLFSPKSEIKLDNEEMSEMKVCSGESSENLIKDIKISTSLKVEEEENKKIDSIKVIEKKNDTESVLTEANATTPETLLLVKSTEEEQDDYFEQKQVNLFSFEEPIEQDFTFPQTSNLDSITEDYQRNGEFVNPNIQFITKGRDLPIIFENDDEEIEEKMLNELHEKLKKEREMYESEESDDSCSDNNDSDEEVYEEIQYLY
jgi:hypothetical protein